MSAGSVAVADEEPMPTEDPCRRQKPDAVETGSASPFKRDDFAGVLPNVAHPKIPTFEEVSAWGKNGAFHKSEVYSTEEICEFFSKMSDCGWRDGDGLPIRSWREVFRSWHDKRKAQSAATERYAQLFERFWDEYPKHENKMGAEQAFAAVMDGCKSDGERSALVEEMLDAIATLKGTKWANPDDDRFIPMPANWLKSRRWTDEVPKSQAQLDAERERLAKSLMDDMRDKINRRGKYANLPE